MASRRNQKVPDLLSDLPARGKKLSATEKTKAESNSAGKLRKPAQQQLPAKRSSSITDQLQTEPTSAKSENGNGELSSKEILDLSMEQNAQRVFDLDLRQRKLTAIPSALSEFKRLKILDLSSNCISDISNLFDNKELRELKLYDNYIFSVCCLDNLKELSSLQLQYNKIEKIGSGLAPVKKLKCLRLDNNSLSSISMKELAPLGQLTYLDLSFNRIDDITAVVSLPTLEELWADNNKITRLPDFNRCKRLRELHISNNEVSSLTTIASLTQLEQLDASGNHVTEFPSAAQWRRLSFLSVAKNRLQAFDWLPACCPNLYTLDISDNFPEAMDQHLVTTLTKLESLFDLTFTNCSTTVQNVQQQLPQLDFYNGATLHRPISGQQQQHGPPPMRPMSAATSMSTRQVEGQFRSMNAKLESLEEQTEQVFQHMRAQLAQKLESNELQEEAGTAASLESGGSFEDAAGGGTQRQEFAPPVSARGSRARLHDALQFGRSSQLS